MHHRKDSLYDQYVWNHIWWKWIKSGGRKKSSNNGGEDVFGLWEEALEDPRGHGEHDIQNGIQNPREGS